jgi:hypothetical protein
MRVPIAPVLCIVLALHGCGQNFGTPHSASSLGNSIGSALGRASAVEAGLDPNQGGSAAALHVRGVFWGRLADVYDSDPETGRARPQAYDLVVGEDLASDGRDFAVEVQPILGKVRVTILHARGSAGYADAYRRLDQGLVPIAEKSLDPAELPPFSMVPRDAAIVVAFDDLLDPATIRAESVRLAAGSGSNTVAARVLPDANHGGYARVDGVTRFYPTRVILDTTVSRMEALESDVPLPVNAVGLPAGTSSGLANCALFLPTAASDPDADLAGLRNLAGHGLAVSGNGPIETSASPSCVVRAFRSGGSTAVTGDAYNGFLTALTQPQVVGDQDAVIDAVSPDPLGGVGDFVIGLTLAVPACAHAARVGDVIQQPAGWAEVVVPSALPVNGQLTHVRVHMILGNQLVPAGAAYLTIYDPVADATREACFVRIRTTPLSPPDAGVTPRAEYALMFTQPMDPATLTALSNFTLTRTPSNVHPDELVPAETRANAADEVRLRPVLPLAHVFGQAEAYYLHLASGPEGVKSSSGAELASAFPLVSIALDPQAATQTSGGYALTFASADEDQNGLPEIRGQFLHDLPRGSIRARPVTHFAAVADRTQAVPGVMAAFGPGVQAPLVSLGCRLQTVWRYCDVGMALSDESTFNVDVEGLDWSPVGGAVIADHFPQFEMRLAHSGFQPDEALGATLLPSYPLSGLATTFASNQLDPVHDPLKTVHPRQLGYNVNPADQFLASTGTPMMPYPLNRAIPPAEFQYYTWRDTALQAQGAPNGAGAELAIVTQVLGSGTPGQPYAAGQVPSIGLPLLMEFDCFPDAGALGLNAFDVSLAINSSPSPNFRAFSSGGIDSNGQPVSVDPDTSLVATGGFNPNSNPPGRATLPAENTFYIGQMDLVVRVSRLNTVWIDTQSANPSYAATAVLEPQPAHRPPGTQVVLAYRGASSVSPALVANAAALDAYGEPISPADSVAYFNADNSWKSSLAVLDGARFAQLRATLVSNARSGAAPSISGLGLAFTRN